MKKISEGLLAGDIGLSTNDAWMSKAIKFMQSLWTKNAKWSHAWAYVGSGYVVEALAKICINPVSRYENSKIAIWRIPLTDEERAAFAIGMMRRVNGAYGWSKYPLFVLDASMSGIKRFFGMKNPCFFFTRHFGISNIPVCSELVVWGIHKFTSYRFKDDQGREVNWRIVSPDYLEDLLFIPANKAKLIL